MRGIQGSPVRQAVPFDCVRHGWFFFGYHDGKGTRPDHVWPSPLSRDRRVNSMALRGSRYSSVFKIHCHTMPGPRQAHGRPYCSHPIAPPSLR
jgi:hypothetical protein